MPRKRDTFKLGMTVIVMFVLLLGCLWFIGGGRLFSAQRKTIVVRFASGGTMPELAEGSFVTYFGQQVGAVVKTDSVVGLDPRDPTIKDQPFLEVQAALFRDLDLREDCKIVASGPPLGGVGMIEIISRGKSPTVIQADHPIYGQVAGFQAALDMITRELDEANRDGLIAMIKTQLDAEDEHSLIARIHLSLVDVNILTANLARELDRGQDGVLLAKLHASVDLINRSLNEIADLVEQNRPRMDNTLASVESASARMDTGVMAVLARELELDADQDVTLLTRFHDSMSCLNQSLADLNVVTDGAKEVVVLNKDRISEVIENVTTASLHLKHGVRDVLLQPWKFIFKPSVAERRELHIHNVAREFAEAAAHLDDSSSRLQSLLDARDGQIASDDPDLLDIRARLLETITKFTAAEQVLWDELAVE